MHARIAAVCAILTGSLLFFTASPGLAAEALSRADDPTQEPLPAETPATSPVKGAASFSAPAEWKGLDFQFQDIQGAPHRLAEMSGHVVLLEFWASWCLPCRKGFPFLNQLQVKHAGEGLKVVGVTLEEEDDAVQSFVESFPGTTFLIGRDPSGKSGELMGVETMPTTFLLGRDGKILVRFEGGGEAIHLQIEKTVEAALKSESLVIPASGEKRAAGPKRSLKAWERGYLADPIMNLDGDVLKRSMRSHIHASKEAAAGDGGVAGGGCGCN